MPQGLDIAFAGTPELAATILARIIQNSAHTVSCVYTQPDRPAGRGRKLHKSPVKELAESCGLTVKQPQDKSELAADTALARADVLVVAAYGMILPEVVLDMPRFGCINIHTSLLPRWRGAAPIQRAIQAGDPVTGITLIQMDAGLDTGDILYQQACPIEPQDTAGSLHYKLADIGSECTLITLDMVSQGRLAPTPQPENGVTYANKIQKVEALINWEKPAVEIDRQIRAFNPAPVAYTTLNGQAMRIWQATVVHDSPGSGLPPGNIVNYSAAGIDVSTGDKLIRILKLQLPGKNTVSCRDFFNGNPEFRKN